MNELERWLYRILCWAILFSCGFVIIPTIQGNLPAFLTTALLLVVIYHFAEELLRND